ncbi:TetR/AcrR family transcriptional regulator [Fodinicola feengrottensis]|uniref:TetR/AcrR family transcriptional regulator n=1 Tax=Fodinicola feengrottensis TaxID=435914 RepID=A0ABN2GTA4_9ACTN|nr:TetR/AcrR family transcriptional regulator [Fodinicola feengrottensis]
MDIEQGRRRAPAMSVEDRRAAIVKATMPLVLEHGANVTTKQIAQAAGIAEGTVFRAFDDKEELIRTCVAEVFKMDDAVSWMRAIGTETPLPERLRGAGMVMQEQMARIGTLMQALAASGHDVRKHHDHKEPKENGPQNFMRNVTEAVAELLEPDRDQLTVPPDQLAQLFLSLVFGARMRYGDQGPTQEQIDAYLNQTVDVLLYGAYRPNSDKTDLRGGNNE